MPRTRPTTVRAMTGDTQPLYPEDLVQSTLPNFEPAPTPPAAPAPAPRATSGTRQKTTTRTTAARATAARPPRKATAKAKKTRRFRFFGRFPKRLVESLFGVSIFLVAPLLRFHLEKWGVSSDYSLLSAIGIIFVVFVILVNFF